ncbi:MAG: leucine-rich repeat domain-containing protein [Clostridiales bacterium]|nr:leucine-rich repeat domain-containing protein [Clostridiales bacterium]
MQWRIYYTIENGEATVTRCVGDQPRLELPDELEGCPVTGLGPDCFAGTAPMDACDASAPVYLRETPPSAKSYKNQTLKHLTLPASLRRAGTRCFAQCAALPRLELPAGLRELGERCFYGCGALEHLELPEGIEILPDYTFAECRKLKRVSLPHSVRTIGRCCFYNCTHLEKLDLPDSLEAIGDRMLMNCFELKELSFRIGVNGGALLAEIDRVMRVRVRYPEETVEVVLTEYALEYEELIQAKQFRTNETGTGGLYRGCFSDRDVDFALYDTYFYAAKLQDPPELLAELAFDRLRWPRELRPAKEQEYWDYLKGHIPELTTFLLGRDDLEGLEFLLSTGRLDGDDLNQMLERAEQAENVRFVSRLLEAAGRGPRSGADKLFEL